MNEGFLHAANNDFGQKLNMCNTGRRLVCNLEECFINHKFTKTITPGYIYTQNKAFYIENLLCTKL